MTTAEKATCSAAEAEHQPAHGHKALERKLEPDQEQQEDDAELGEGDDLSAGDGHPVEGRNRR